MTGGGLGPAVTAEFTSDAGIGLQDLIGAGHGPSSRGGGRPITSAEAPTPPSALPVAKVEVDERLILKTLQLMDQMISAFANVPTESADDLEPLTATLKPLADYYASDAPSVTMLWIFAALGIGGYSLTKYQRYRSAHPPQPKAQSLPMKAADGSTVTVEQLATPPGGE